MNYIDVEHVSTRLANMLALGRARYVYQPDLNRFNQLSSTR